MNRIKIFLTMTNGNGEEYGTMGMVCVPESEMRECGPIDYPAAGTDPFTEKVFCTPVKVREVVEENRKRLAETITKQILECLSADDTIMGYKRSRK